MKIRKIEDADLLARVDWMNNPLIYKTMHFIPPISLENTKKWFESNLNNNKRFDAAFENEEGRLVAFGGLTNIDYTVRKAEFYVFVNPAMQSRGIGTTATRMLCKYGFDILQLHKIYLYTNSSNIGAKKTYEKVGFVLEGVHREENIIAEKYEDRLYYGLLAKDFDSCSYPLDLKGWNGILMEVCSIGNQENKLGGVKLHVVRDDIFPFIGGGSKARKAVAYEKFLRLNGYNAVVTCGGVQSNHNRAMALMCARNGWKCHLCIQGTEERFLSEKGNALLNRLSGAICELVRPEDTSVAMDRAMEALRLEGYNPYYVIGGGHNLPGGTCFVEAVEELKRQCDVEGWKPDYIFHASGTGSTQAGIAVGLDKVGWTGVKLVGISVARQQQRGREMVVAFANMLAEHYGLPQDYEEKIIFTADYLMGGYEQYTEEMKLYLGKVMLETGLMFDMTYSGKGFWGMMQEIKRLGLQDKKILFWHTGGLMNLMK